MYLSNTVKNLEPMWVWLFTYNGVCPYTAYRKRICTHLLIILTFKERKTERDIDKWEWNLSEMTPGQRERHTNGDRQMERDNCSKAAALIPDTLIFPHWANIFRIKSQPATSYRGTKDKLRQGERERRWVSVFSLYQTSHKPIIDMR